MHTVMSPLPRSRPRTFPSAAPPNSRVLLPSGSLSLGVARLPPQTWKTTDRFPERHITNGIIHYVTF